MPSRKDTRREQSVCELSVRLRTRSRSAVENGIALTSITGDATACDQQFTRLKNMICNAPAPHHGELEPLLFPMFTHTYLEMLANGHKVPAQKFHERHSEMFSESKKESFSKTLKNLESKADIMSYKEVSEQRENRFLLNLQQDSMEYLMRFLKTEEAMVILQIFNQCVKVNVSSTVSNPGLELANEPGEADVKPDITVKTEKCSEEQELMDAIQAVKELPPCLPSICLFMFLNTYQGLCSSTISPDQSKLSGSFEDSSLTVWHLKPDMFQRQATDTDVSHVMLGADHMMFTETENKDRLNKRAGQTSETARLIGHRGPVYKSQFLHNTSSHLLSCSEDATVRLWDLSTQTNVSLYKGHSSAVWDLSVSSTDAWFASCSHDTTAKLWTLDRTYPLRSYAAHTFDVDCVEFHPNNNYIATGSADKTVRFWSVSEGRCVRLLQGHRGSVLALAFSPDGKMLASAGEDRRVRVWDLGTGRLLKELRGHSEVVYTLAFDENSQVLASGGADCCLRLWDVKKTPDTHQLDSHCSPELLGGFPTKSALLNYLHFSPHNLLLAAGDNS